MNISANLVGKTHMNFWIFFEYLVTIFESFVTTHFVFAFNKFDFKKNKNKAIFIWASLGDAILVNVLNNYTVYEGILGVLYIAYIFVIALIFLKSSIGQKLFSSVLSVLITLVTSSTVASMVSAAFRDGINDIYSTPSISRLIFIVVVQMLQIIIYDAILKTTDKERISLNKKEWALIISVLSVSFFAIVSVHAALLNFQYAFFPAILLLFAEACLVAIITICFYMTLSLSRARKDAEELSLIKQQKEQRHQYAENIKRQYEETQMIKHDIKQIYSIIASLISKGKYDEALEYIGKADKNVALNEAVINVNNDLLNAILNSKINFAQTNDIEVFCVAEKNISGIENEDLCTLLGNMLDNAIEACVKCDKKDRFMEINISSYTNKIIITVSNTVQNNVLSDNESLITTKPETDLHGFGIKSIRQIAKKYNGNLHFYQEDNLFTSEVVLMK